MKALLLTIGLFEAILVGNGGVAEADTIDWFDQRNFPCAEDEVLGYAPQFGPDRVGCIHIDTIRGEA
ncbi:hypothetical protein SEA_PANAMAXUS_82 [Mycobacterium phage Panamaxus]|uniref:Uncharacterized protein n=1 Tax=Mycobacterium phage Veracruz TaxID=2530154 RepID=A0A481VTJ7_9CAUD|nr:hypothetical protein KIP27_gp09 [Mycobacterium phage Veracruz]AIS73759.1 hypothetical protein PBI_QUINNKIRO_85 [Mycobacterium phage QuinnKiro]ALA11887.1 hypothetical protein SEA_TEXAGE_84 [Mycobacterium phage Texage]AOT24234.1 hypothetical protein SEA_TODACORO_86 [Mycobacterium phage Todacoro]AOT25587.1 hypothetical protein SEA_MARGO_86 [Mycobacterium phage Margo]AUX82381.1 hypothetical protein SEA_LAMBERT1_86 [Mycobacterium phage Lambert1]AVP42997.1 hypothetical protein SEA_PANAMAXUS_82 [